MPNWKKIIVSGSDASLSSLHIDGNLTASAAYLTSASIGHLETIYETASVIYSSGSTKFGDTSDDTHEYTGSLSISGSISIVEGSQLTGTASHALTAITSSHTAGTASFANTATTSSYTLTGDGVFSGSFSGSFVGDASNLNVNPFPFTGSGEMQGKLTIESFNDYIDDYVEQYFAGTAIASSGDIALTGSIFSPYINADGFTGSLSGSFTGSGIIDSASLAETSSFVETAQTASFYGGSVTSASLAETASFVEISKKQLVSVISNDLTASLYTTHVITSPLSMSAPTSPGEGDWFKISQRVPSGSNFTSSLLFGNGSQIMSASTELELDVEDQGLEFIYTNATQGWIIIGN